MKCRSAIQLLVLAWSFFSANAVCSATFTVRNTNDDGPASLRQAIREAAQGDTIQVDVAGTIVLSSGELLLDKSLNVTGPGARLLTISGNRSQRIFRVSGDQVVIAGFTLANGVSNARGGAIFNSGGLTVDRCTVTANNATADTDGGGFYNEGNLTLTNSTFANNSASAQGGAIANAGVISAQNCTFRNNSALQGGAIATMSVAVSRISNCTVDANHSLAPNGSGGGGLFIGGGSLWLMNCIVVNNTAAAGSTARDVGASSLLSGDHNLISDNAGWRFRTGDGAHNIVGLDPKLDGAGLRNNGGPTDTIRLLPGSPAIGTGNDSFAPMVDQRGQPCVGVHDLGAFESGGPFYPAMMANLSSRLRVDKGDDVLIGGFIVTGSQPKRLMVRALGPSIPVAGTLADPRLDIYQGPTPIAANNNWRDADNILEMIQSGVAPARDLEAAVLGTFSPGSYTAVVSGAGAGTGLSLVEVYDLDQTVEGRLANVATRGRVQTGDNVLIAGLIVVGFEPQKVIVRAIGPSLNLSGKLADPTLEFRDAHGTLVRADDNWRTGGQETEIIQSGVAPTDDRESALIQTLSGNAAYTAIVRGVNNTTGIAVVEVYALN